MTSGNLKIRALRIEANADQKETILIWSAVISVLAVGCLALIANQREKHKWNSFAKDHDCRIVERMRGSVDTAVAPIFDGKGGVSYAIGATETPDKTAYLCNDGVKYWR